MTKRRPSSDRNRPWHRGSVFGPGRRQPLDRNGKARWRYLAHCHIRASRIGPKGAWALELLPDYLARDGRCDPSHARLAADAGISVSAVADALADAKALGLLDWERRLVRNGWRAEQTSNAYVLLLPGEGEGGPPPPRLPVPKPLKLESAYTVAVTVAALTVSDPAARAARVAAKIAEEKRLRRQLCNSGGSPRP